MGIILGVVVSTSVWAAEDGLVAHWDFDEGKGDILHDRSGNKNHGRIRGAKWVKVGDGFALRFDGMDDYVDCGKRPGLDLRRAVSLEAWVMPEAIPQGEVGVVGQSFSSYLITYWHNARCYWYICEGGHNCNANLPPGVWSHLVGTFDAASLKLYINGALVGTRKSKHRTIEAGKHFAIGCILQKPGGAQPAASGSYFKGMIDEVRVYNRALAPMEVRTHYRRLVRTRKVGASVDFSPLTEGTELRGENFLLRLGNHGRMQVDIGTDAYVLDSSFSYPGKRIGTNRLSEKAAGNEAGWQPKMEAKEEDAAQITAQGRHYSVKRSIRLQGHRVAIEDTMTNLTQSPVGVIIRNQVTLPKVPGESFLAGKSENPLILLGEEESRLGLLIEDLIGRQQFEPIGFSNLAGFEMAHFALGAGESYTFKWAIYPLGKDADYFTFINRIREDWKTNFMIDGPFQFLHARRAPTKDPAALKAHVKRKKLKIIAMGPWLDYWSGQDLNRAQTKKWLKQGVRNIKQIDQDIRCLGEIETDWVALRPEQIPGFDKLPVHKGGRSTTAILTPEQVKVIEQANLPWTDSFVRRRNGMIMIELFQVRGHPFGSINVYPRLGNYQYRFMMEQARFLLEEVGMDGLYIDDFNQARRYSYERWDGVTVDIDPATGKIARKYTDRGLVGADVRKNICDYVLARGGSVVTNTCAAAPEMQALPIFRFLELPLGTFSVYTVKDGEKPPFLGSISRAHLASPIGLGVGFYKPGIKAKDYARGLMKGLITYLRHGLLYYHYDPSIPETGEGSGEYGPINHMFPITPVRLFEGGIEGKERTITCVSGTYTWPREQPPRVLLFDSVGREKAHGFKTEKTDAGWKIVIQLADWQEIAVIEE